MKTSAINVVLLVTVSNDMPHSSSILEPKEKRASDTCKQNPIHESTVASSLLTTEYMVHYTGNRGTSDNADKINIERSQGIVGGQKMNLSVIHSHALIVWWQLTLYTNKGGKQSLTSSAWTGPSPCKRNSSLRSAYLVGCAERWFLMDSIRTLYKFRARFLKGNHISKFKLNYWYCSHVIPKVKWNEHTQLICKLSNAMIKYNLHFGLWQHQGLHFLIASIHGTVKEETQGHIDMFTNVLIWGNENLSTTSIHKMTRVSLLYPPVSALHVSRPPRQDAATTTIQICSRHLSECVPQAHTVIPLVASKALHHFLTVLLPFLLLMETTAKQT